MSFLLFLKATIVCVLSPSAVCRCYFKRWLCVCAVGGAVTLCSTHLFSAEEEERTELWRHLRKQRMSCKLEPGLMMFWVTTGSSSALYCFQNLCLRAYLPPAFRDRLPFSSKQFHWADVDWVRDQQTLTEHQLFSQPKLIELKCSNYLYLWITMTSIFLMCTVLSEIMFVCCMFCPFRSYCSSQIWHRKDLRVHYHCFGLAYTGEHSDTGILALC